MDNLGDRLKKIRIDNELTIRELADKISISKSNISNYEQNKSTPAANIIVRYSELFKLTTDWILKGEETQLNLSEEEKEVLELFNKLSDKEKWKLIGQLEYITKSNEEQTATIEGKSSVLKNTV